LTRKELRTFAPHPPCGHCEWLLRPFRACCGWFGYPGRRSAADAAPLCPGLICCGPFGAKRLVLDLCRTTSPQNPSPQRCRTPLERAVDSLCRQRCGEGGTQRPVNACVRRHGPPFSPLVPGQNGGWAGWLSLPENDASRAAEATGRIRPTLSLTNRRATSIMSAVR